MKKYILTLDQGTTSSRAIIFNHNQEVVAIAQTPITQIYPQSGWVEQDALHIWSTQNAMMYEVMGKANITPQQIEAIAITNQRETFVVWDKETGLPVYNAIVWQCKRTDEYCESIKEYESFVNEKTGLTIDSYFSATKLKWLLDNVDGVKEKAKQDKLLFGTIDTWLLYKLTDQKVHKTDMTNASRTMLYNIHTLSWDKDLLELFDIPISLLPQVCESGHFYGTTNIQGYDIPIMSMVGDQQASLFGHQCFNKGDIKSTYGTGCFILMNTKDTCVKSQHGLLSTIGISYNGHVSYALEGSVFAAGSIISWLRDKLELIEDHDDLNNLIENTKTNEGVYFVPAFSGLGAPHWNGDLEGSLFGLHYNSDKAIIVRACLESIAYQVNDVIGAMLKDADTSMNSIKVDGGVSNNDFIMQFQADILDKPIQRNHTPETTALGAFYLAALTCQYYKSEEELNLVYNGHKIEPNMKKSEKEELIKGWNRALKATITFSNS